MKLKPGRRKATADSGVSDASDLGASAKTKDNPKSIGTVPSTWTKVEDMLMVAAYFVMIAWAGGAFVSVLWQEYNEKASMTGNEWAPADPDYLRLLAPFGVSERLQQNMYDKCDILRTISGNLSTVDDSLPYVVMDSSHLWNTGQQKWDRKNFKATFGNLKASVRSVSSAVFAQFGHAPLRNLFEARGYVDPGLRISLSDFLDNMRKDVKEGNNSTDDAPSMIFDVTGAGDVAVGLMDTYPLLPSFISSSWKRWRRVVSMGRAGAGLAFHAHGPAWLAVVHGVKLWFLIPPEKFPPPQLKGLLLNPMDRSQARRFLEASKITDKDGPSILACAVRSGEAIVVPEGWHHATLNLGETIAIGAQASDEVDRFPDIQNNEVPLQRHPQIEGIKSALQASQYGDAAFRRGDARDVALAFFKRATQIEPLNFKCRCNLIAAYLSHQRYEDAVSTSTDASSLVLEVASASEAAYVHAYLGLLFFETASALHDKQPEHITGNLLDMVIRLLDMARSLVGDQGLPAHVYKVRDVANTILHGEGSV